MSRIQKREDSLDPKYNNSDCEQIAAVVVMQIKMFMVRKGLVGIESGLAKGSGGRVMLGYLSAAGKYSLGGKAIIFSANCSSEIP